MDPVQWHPLHYEPNFGLPVAESIVPFLFWEVWSCIIWAANVVYSAWFLLYEICNFCSDKKKWEFFGLLLLRNS